MFVAKALSPSNPRKYMRCGVAACIGGLFHLQLGRSFHVQYPYIQVSQSKITSMYPNGHALTLACPPFPLVQIQDPHAIRAMCFSSLIPTISTISTVATKTKRTCLLLDLLPYFHWFIHRFFFSLPKVNLFGSDGKSTLRQCRDGSKIKI